MGVTTLEAAAFLTICAPFLHFVYVIPDSTVRAQLVVSLAGSLVVFLATAAAVPRASKYMLRRGLFGKDLGKKGSPLGEVEVCVGSGWGRGVEEDATIWVPPLLTPAPLPTARLRWALCAGWCT